VIMLISYPYFEIMLLLLVFSIVNGKAGNLILLLTVLMLLCWW